MTLPFKPHLIALVCSAGLFAASGVLYVKSRAPEAPAQAATPAPEQTQATVPAPVAKTTFTTAQIDQWVAPVALYPDALLSQVLMASTYPANVVRPSSGREITPRCRAMPLFRRWPANRGTPASNRWSPFPS